MLDDFEIIKWCGVVVSSVLCSIVISYLSVQGRRWWVNGDTEAEGYIVTKEVLGRGGYGEVRRGVKFLWGRDMIAVKIGNRVGKDTSILKRMKGMEGFADLKFSQPGMLGMQLLGPSLESIMKKMPGKKFDVKTVLLIADQALRRVETLHRKRILHRDIKPENFCLGMADCRDTLFLVDFGLSEKYFNGTTLQHTPYREGRTVYGTPYFSSLNADKGCEQARRDDLESLAYMLIYLAKGTLPWIGLRSQGPLKTWHTRLHEMKRATNPQLLCEGLPFEFTKFLSYCRGLRYSDTPEYEYLQGMFARRYAKLGYEADGGYQWKTIGAHWKCWERGGPAGNIEVEREEK